MRGGDKQAFIKDYKGILEEKMAKTGPVEYLRQVRNEMKKVTWPSRQETTVSMIAVFIMVFMASTFLFFADQMIAYLVREIMSIGL